MPRAKRSDTPDEPEAGVPPGSGTPPDPVEPVRAGRPVTIQIGPQGHVTIAMQPAPEFAAADLPVEEATAKGLFGGKDDAGAEPGPFEQVRQSIKNALETLGAKIADFAKDISALEVRTYVSDRIEEVQHDDLQGFQNAHQRAYTYIEFDGDTQVVVPVDAGQIDEALWKIHLQTVEQAQAHRQAMLKTVGDLVTGLIPTLK